MEQDQDKIQQLIEVLKKHEEKMSWTKPAYPYPERTEHILSEYRKLADNAIWSVKNYMEDVKSQFKALIIVLEGLTDGNMNHGQKRVIANHVITMLRAAVDKMNNATFEWDFNILERYDFFRTTTPEAKIHQKARELKQQTDQQEKILKMLKEVHPEIYKSLTTVDDIPF